MAEDKMINETKRYRWIPYLVVTVVAIFVFVMLYGVKILNPLNVDWLYGRYEAKENCFYGHDLSQHYIGWMGYRNGAWTFPIGNSDSLSYPYMSSVIFTDSIPLFALIFKVLSPILPRTFQYFGIWGLLCFVLQGIMAVRLFRHYTDRTIRLSLCGSLFVIAPVLLWRMFIHTALSAHWIILMALEPVVCRNERKQSNIWLQYGLVSFFAAMTSMYMVLLCGIVLVGYLIRSVMQTKKPWNACVSLAIYLAVAVLCIGMMGGFAGGNGEAGVGLGMYSMNLNAAWNAYGYSMIFPELPRYTWEGGDGQYEGYAYLGLGCILLILLTFIWCIVRFKKVKKILKKNKKVWISLLVVGILAFLFAVSPYVTAGDKLLFKIPVPAFVEKVWSIFRSTGRGAWILVYLGMFLAGALVCKMEKKYLPESILLIAIALQVTDCGQLYGNIHRYFAKAIEPVHSFAYNAGNMEVWEQIGSDTAYKHVVLATTTTPYSDEEDFTLAFSNGMSGRIGPSYGEYINAQYMLGDYAMKYGKTMNYFNMARNPYDRSREYVISQLGSPEEDTVYVFWEYNKMQAFAAGLHVYKAGNLYIGTVRKLENIKELEAAESSICISFGSLITNGEEQFKLAREESFKGCVLELPAGLYQCSLASNHGQNIELMIKCDGEVVSSELSSSGDGTWILQIEKDCSSAYIDVRNIGDEDAILDTLQITYIEAENE